MLLIRSVDGPVAEVAEVRGGVMTAPTSSVPADLYNTILAKNYQSPDWSVGISIAAFPTLYISTELKAPMRPPAAGYSVTAHTLHRNRRGTKYLRLSKRLASA